MLPEGHLNVNTSVVPVKKLPLSCFLDNDPPGCFLGPDNGVVFRLIPSDN